MHLRYLGVLILIWLFCEAVAVNKSIAAGRGFLIYRTISVTQRSCNCSMSFSCSCCQSVVILYTRREKNLCINFTYQRNGLNVDVTLDSNAINARTITNYRPLQFCVYVPGCLFSSACVNIWEFNIFSTSITACLRLDVYAKKQLWQINYGCMNISTELPIIPTNGNTMEATDARNGQMGTTIPSETVTIGISEAEATEATEMTEQTNGMIQEMNSAQAEQMTID